MSYFSTGAELQAAIAALPASKIGSYVPFDVAFYSANYMADYQGDLAPYDHFVQIGAPKLNKREDPKKWLSDKQAPWAKLANEKPKGETIAYDTLLNAWKAGKAR